MKRSALFAVVGAVFLLTASCSKDGAGGGSQGSGGSGGAKTGAGGSIAPGGSGGASGTGGSVAASGAGGSGVFGTGGSSAGSGGSIGSGGTTTSTTTRDAAASGGALGSGGSSVVAGSGGASTAKGGATGSGGAVGGATGTAGAGTGGKAGTGGAMGTGGAAIVDGGTVDGGSVGVAPSSGCGKATTLTSARASIDVSGKTRQYILALPKNYDQNHPYKLVFAWHPWTGSAQMIASGGYYGLLSKSNNEAIFIAADGQDFQDAGLGWGNSGGEDVAFYHAMLDRLRAESCVDENRIFSVGFSFGAMFSFTLGCTADSMTRAIVPMAGNTMTSGGCAAGNRPVAVMAFIGLQDSLLSGHRQAVTTYATRDGCSTQTAPMQPSWCDGLNSTNLPCTCVSYQGCQAGYPVISCEYTAGHQQAPNPGPIWDFLAQF